MDWGTVLALATLMAASVGYLSRQMNRLDDRLTARIDRVETSLGARIDHVEAHLASRIDQLTERYIAHLERHAD